MNDNPNNKVIVSSRAMADLLTRTTALHLKCEGKLLSLGDETICVECRTDFECEMDQKQRDRMLAVLRAVGEQPVVLTFKGAGDFVELDQVLL